jgi:cytochrome c peroxidase
MHRVIKYIWMSAVCLSWNLQAAETEISFDKEKKAALRELANSVFGPLPDAMPGSEKDSDHLRHLGEKLFFDTGLSKNNTISCNSCHRIDQGLGGVDNASGSTGAFGDVGDRNAPTVLNAGFQLSQFWDGRAADLKAQAKGPVLNPIEMAMPHEGAVLDRIRMDDTYRSLFRKAFPDSDPVITYDNVAHAIAAFERTLITEDRFDDFLEGDDESLTDLELKGLETFTSIGCVTCHTGALLGGGSYQKTGLVNPYENFSDVGRESVTKNPDDKFKFKVPTLRNIAITAPYFHDGGVATLGFAVRKMAFMQLGLQLTSDQTESLLAFLGALTDKQRHAP